MYRLAGLLLICCSCASTSTTLSDHIDALNATMQTCSAHVDALSMRLDRVATSAAPAPAAAPQAGRIACRGGEIVDVAEGEKLQERDVDLGHPGPGADPADGIGVKGKPASAIIARCKAGKL